MTANDTNTEIESKNMDNSSFEIEVPGAEQNTATDSQYSEVIIDSGKNHFISQSHM